MLRLLISGCLLAIGQASTLFRLVSWNVGDNAGMDGGFKEAAMDKLLGIDVAGAKVADIFAIGLQELCWHCNKEDLTKIPAAFKSRLSSHGDYEVLGVVDTLKSSECKALCEKGTHGTVALFVIAKRGVISSHLKSSYNDGCSDKTPPNKEKGVAFMRLSLSTGQSVCVSTSHLESRSPKFRRQCMKNFLKDAAGSVKWPSCDFQFISGDMNMRTAKSAPANQPETPPSKAKLLNLKMSDELIGKTPFGSDDDWSGNMLDFINSVQKKVFKESPIHFLPTYKFTSKCKVAKPPCYKTSRPMSWTDRIIHVGGSSLKYDSLNLAFSDHKPVFEEFQL